MLASQSAVLTANFKMWVLKSMSIFKVTTQIVVKMYKNNVLSAAHDAFILLLKHPHYNEFFVVCNFCMLINYMAINQRDSAGPGDLSLALPKGSRK